MEALDINRQVLTWSCIYECDDSISMWKRLSYKLFIVVVFILNLCGGAATLVYLLRNMSPELVENMFAFAMTIVFFSANVGIIVQFILRRPINEVFKQLTKIYDECMYKKYVI